MKQDRTALATANGSQEKYVYIIVSQTGTILSRILKLMTHAKYNHASIAFDPALKTMYSFGRIHAYNPFLAGLVRESLYHGTFHRFKNTDTIILTLAVDPQTHRRMLSDVRAMYRNKKDYHYNYLGLCYAFFGVKKQYARTFYCSEFVEHMLKKYKLASFDPEAIIKPMDLCAIRGGRVIYRGRLQDFKPAKVAHALAAPS